MKHVDFEAPDILLLCTDGLYQNYSLQELKYQIFDPIHQFLNTGDYSFLNPNYACKNLVQKAI